MAKKQSASLADKLVGSTQPVSANNQPEDYQPIQPGETFDINKIIEFNKSLNWPSRNRETTPLPYKGKYYIGAETDPSQETIQGENQPWTSKLFNGLVGNTLSVATKFLSGAGEVAGGLADVITNIIPGVAAQRKTEFGTAFPHMFENAFAQGIQDIENNFIKDKVFPVYGGQGYQNGTMLDRMADMKWWSGDLADAVAYTVAFRGSATPFIKAAKAMGMVAKTAKGIELSQTGKQFVQIATATYNTSAEAGLEAYNGLENIREDLSDRYYKKSYNSLEIQEKQRVNSEAGPLAANIFKSNVGVLVGPNLLMSRFLLGSVKKTTPALHKLIRNQKLDPQDIKVMRKALGTAGLGAVSESWEEGSQNAVQNYEANKINGTYGTELKRLPGYLYEYANNFYDTEGLSQFIIGGVIGSVMGGGSKYLETRKEKAEAIEYAKTWKGEATTEINLAKNLFPADVKTPFKKSNIEVERDGKKVNVESIINPETGKREFDLDKVIKIHNAKLFNNEVFNNLLTAILSNNEVQEKFFLDQSLGNLFYSYINNKAFENSDEAFETLLDNNGLKSITENPELAELELDTQYMTTKLKQMKGEYDRMQKKLLTKEDIDNNSPSYLRFRDLVDKAYFYNKIKLNWLNEVGDQIENPDELSNLTNKANRIIDILEDKSKRKELYEDFKKQGSTALDLNVRYLEERQKDPNSIETRKYQYLIKENELINGKNNIPDVFAITKNYKEIFENSGLKTEHYLNRANDAIVGIRLDSKINQALEGNLTAFTEAVNLLITKPTGVLETTGKYDVTESDIEAVKKTKAIVNPSNDQDAMTDEKLAAFEQNIDMQTMVGEPVENAEEQKNNARKKNEKYNRDLNEFNRASEILDNITGNPNSKSLLSSIDELTNTENIDSVFQRAVADNYINESDNIINSLKSNPNFNDYDSASKILKDLKLLKEVYDKTDLKERLDTKPFKGFINKLNKNIDLLEKSAEEIKTNFIKDQDIDKNNQIYRNTKKIESIGYKIVDNEVVLQKDNPETVTINNLIADIIGIKTLNDIITGANNAITAGDIYFSHEVFTDKIIHLIKNTRNKSLRDKFYDYVFERYNIKINELLDMNMELAQKSLGPNIKISTTKSDKYKVNPRRVFPDILSSHIGTRLPDIERKTSIDIYRNNGDIVELYNNLLSEKTTGYGGLQKDILQSLIEKQIYIESIQDIVNNFNSSYDHDAQIKAELSAFKEFGKSPTNQQINSLRQASIWYNKKLSDDIINGTNPLKARFKNWLFIKGTAGTGKTQVMVKFLIRTLGIKPSEVQFIAPHKNSAKILNDSNKNLSTRDAILLDQLSDIDSDIKLVIVDEIAAISGDRLFNETDGLASKLWEINKNRKNKFRVIVLGDPNQLAADERGFNVSFEPSINSSNEIGMEYVSVTDPLTIKFRSLIPQNNQTIDLFEDNYNEVRDITVYASHKLGQPSVGIHTGDLNQLASMLKAHSGNGKSKAIIVLNNDVRKTFETTDGFKDNLNDIYTLSEIPGTEYDEVYVYLNRKDFDNTHIFNKAVYTAASRHKQYVFLFNHNDSFKNDTKTDIENALLQKDEFKNQRDNELKDRNEKFLQRNRYEQSVMDNNELKKDEKETIKEEKSNETNTGTHNYEETVIDSSTNDPTGQDEENAYIPQDVIYVKGTDPAFDESKEFIFGFPTGEALKRVKIKPNETTPRLIANGDVIFVKTKDTTKKNEYTIHALGQLYGMNEQPIPNGYVHLAIVSNEELANTELGKEIVNRAKVDAWMTLDWTNKLTKDVSVKGNQDAVLMHGKLTTGIPLSYIYDDAVQKKGPKLINDLLDVFNHKLLNREDISTEYFIHIFSKTDKQKEENIKKYGHLNFHTGVPYLIINKLKNGDKVMDTQFIRLNPVNINEGHKIILTLRELSNTVNQLESLIGDRAKLGSDKFNNTIDLFKVNFRLNGEEVEFYDRMLLYDQYKLNDHTRYIPFKNENEFYQFSDLMKQFIPLVYGKGLSRVRYKNEEQMKYVLKLNNDGIDEKGEYQYRFVPKKWVSKSDNQEHDRGFGEALRKNLKNTNEQEDFYYEGVLQPGVGVVQTYLNVLAKANKSVNGFTLRTENYVTRNTQGKKTEGEWVTTAKSILNTDTYTGGYYSELRKILQRANIPQFIDVLNSKNEVVTVPVPWYITDENLDEVENVIIKNRLISSAEFVELNKKHIAEPITSKVLNDIVNFSGSHSELRTPLEMDYINKRGATMQTIKDNLTELESLLQSNLRDIIPSRAGVVTEFSGEKKVTVEHKPFIEKKGEKTEEDLIREKFERDKGKFLLRRNDLHDDGYLGKPMTQAQVRKYIKSKIKDITDDQIQFLDKQSIDQLANDRVWGLYQDGIIYLLKNEDGTVYRNIARHEVFHKIFTEYLTFEQQTELEKVAKKEFIDWKDFSDIEECLAVKWHLWNRGVLQIASDIIKKYFNKFLSLFNIYRDPKTIEDIFSVININRYKKQLNSGDGITKKLKEIKSKFGSVDIYLRSLVKLTNDYREIQLEGKTYNGVDRVFLTPAEVRDEVKKYYNVAVRMAEELKNSIPTKENIEEYELTKKINDNYTDLIKDMWPGFSNFKSGTYFSKLSEDLKNELTEEKHTTNPKDTYLDNSKVNNEFDVTPEVKQLLSYILVNYKGEAPLKSYMATTNGEYLSWRYVYPKLIQMFEGLSLEDGKELDQLIQNYRPNHLNKNEEAILKFLMNIYDRFTSDLTTDFKTLDPKYKFINENLFIYSKDRGVQHIKHPSDPKIDNEIVNKITRKPGEHSKEFYSRITDETGLTNNQISEYGSRNYYNDIWTKLVNQFNSQRQRNPKIGEREASFGGYEIRYMNARGGAISTGIRDKIKSRIGDKFETKKDVIDFYEKDLSEWKTKYGGNHLAFVKNFFSYIGLSQYAMGLTTYNISNIYNKIIDTFKTLKEENIGDEFLNPSENVVKDEDINRSENELNTGTYTTDYFLGQEKYNSFINDLTDAVSLLDNLSRILSSNDAKNNRRYNAIWSSQGHKNLLNIIKTKTESTKNIKLKKVFKNQFYKNNIFLGESINTIYRVIDDDGFREINQKGNEWVTEYYKEKREDFGFREFTLGFLSSIIHSGKNEPKYIQYIYPNKRTTPLGIEIKMLKREELLEGIKRSIKQIVERNDLNEKYDKYNKNSYLGFEILGEILGDKLLTKKDISNDVYLNKLALDIYNKLDEQSKEYTKNLIYDRTIFDTRFPRESKLNNFVDKTLYPEFNIDNLPKHKGKGKFLKLTETNAEFEARMIKENKPVSKGDAYLKGEEKNYLVTEDNIQALSSLYFINNYINSYHFAQLITGDLASFDSVDTLINRLSIALAPGRSGYIDSQYGMNWHSRVAVIADPVNDTQSIKDYLKVLMPNLSNDELDKMIELYPKDYKPGDSQGYILPERLEDINKGFGYNYGYVLKGVYYHIEDDGAARAIKYSQIVLSDELCEKHPALKILREKMRNNIDNQGNAMPIDEVIFDSALKVGKTKKLNDWYNITGNNNIVFDDETQFLMDNTDYRIQLDPEADLESEVSYPTQLSYELNLYGTNNEVADEIYRSITSIIKNNFESLQEHISGKTMTEILKNFLEKTNQDNLYDILSEGINPNFPAITERLINSFISQIFNYSIKTKFSGTKLILQSALGVEKVFENNKIRVKLPFNRELEFKLDKNGSLYAECIVPEGILSKEAEKKIKDTLANGKEPDDLWFAGFSSKDLLAYRSPSTDLHNAVPIKIVGFYDNQGTNVIIAPDIITLFQGSDYDIDSLFTIYRSTHVSYEEGSDVPVGYKWNNTKKRYDFQDNKFLDKIEDNKTRRELTEAYHLNNITENIIKGISSKENIARMISPVYTGGLKAEKDRIIEKIYKKDKLFDPSNAIHKQKIHESITVGEDTIGFLMSLFKVFSFMHRGYQKADGTKHSITELKDPINNNIRFNRKSYNSMVDYTDEKDSSQASGSRFEKLANAAVDNLKERILPYFNMGTETVRAYSVMIMHGIPFNTINNFMNQPILRYQTKYGRLDGVLLNNRINELFPGEQKGIELEDKEMLDYMGGKFTPEYVKSLLYKNSLTTEEERFLRFQKVVIDQYNNLKSLGTDLGKVVKITNVMRTIPNNIDGLQNLLNDAKDIFGIVKTGSVLNTGNDTESKFPYYMNEFLTTNPHIAEALKVIEWTVNKAKAELIVYDDKYNSIADKVIAGTKIEFDNQEVKNKKRIRDEFNKFIMSANVDRSQFKNEIVKLTKMEDGKKVKKQVVLTGINAFNYRFCKLIDQAQTMDQIRINESDPDPVTGKKYNGNIFLHSLSIKPNWLTGMDRVTFHGPAAMDNRDYNLYKQSFKDMNNFDFEYINGKFEYKKFDTPLIEGYTDFQKMFIDYAFINYGMQFGLTNYSKVLPPSLYKDRSDDLVETMNKVLSYNDTQINNIVSAFEKQLVINYPEALMNNSERIRVGEDSIVYSEKDSKGKPISYTFKLDNGVTVDRMFFSKNDKNKSWPKYHVEKFNDTTTVFIRITNPESINAKYIRLGAKNNIPSYNLVSLKDALTYSEFDKFGGVIANGIKLIKGIRYDTEYYENKFIDLKRNDRVSLSDYDDPGNMYSKEYVVTDVMGKKYFHLEKVLTNLFSSAMFTEENRYVNTAYDQLVKRLRAKKTPFRGLGDYILIKKWELNAAREFYNKINNEEFGGLRIISDAKTPLGMQVFINKELLGQFLYGRQLDIFRDGTGLIAEEQTKGIINVIANNPSFKKFGESTYSVDIKVANQIKEFSNTYDGKTVLQILDDIEERATNLFTKQVIRWIRPHLQKNEPVFIGNEKAIWKHYPTVSKRGYGIFDPFGKIMMDYRLLAEDGRNIKYADRVMVHELLHAVTSISLSFDSEFRNKIKRWVNYVKKTNPQLVNQFPLAFNESEDDVTFGTEFISEYFASEKFNSEMNRLKLVDMPKTVGNQICDWIIKILNKIIGGRLSENMEKYIMNNVKDLNYFKELSDGSVLLPNGRIIKDEEDIQRLTDELRSSMSILEDTKTIKGIADQWSDIYIPEDDSGTELNYFLDGKGNKYGFVGDIYEGLISKFRKQGRKETYGERKANDIWGTKDHNSTEVIDRKEMTFDQYKEYMDKRMLLGKTKERLIQLYNKLNADQLYNNGTNEFAIKSEMQEVGYKTHKLTDSKGNTYEISIAEDPQKYQWYNANIAEIWNTHGINALNDIPTELKDYVMTDFVIANDKLKYADRVDLMVEHTDESISLKTVATGRDFDNFITSRLLKYGDQNRDVLDRPRDTKKLQLMWDAFILKSRPENKDIRFRDLSVMYVADEHLATEYDRMRKVDVADYLNMIKLFLNDKVALKEAGIDENIYKTLIENSSRLFQVSEYTYEYDPKMHGLTELESYYQDEILKEETITQLLSNGKSPTEMAEDIMNEMARIQGKATIDIQQGTSKYEGLSTADQAKIKFLTNQLIQLRSDPETDMSLNPQLDISMIEGILGNWSELSIPQVQLLKKLRDQKRQEFRDKINTYNNEHNGWYRKVVDEYNKNHPGLLNNRRFNLYDYNKMFDFMYKDEEVNGGIRRRMRVRNLDGKEFTDLTKAQQDYLDFLNNHYKSYFEGPNAYLKTISTYKPDKTGEFRPISVLENYNDGLQGGEKFKYYDGWFPKVNKEMAEMAYDYGNGVLLKGMFNPKLWKILFDESKGYYTENNFTGRNHGTMTIPLMYMGNSRIEDRKDYTLNADESFSSFTSAIEYKRHMDPIYAAGQGVRAWLDSQTPGGQFIYKDSSKMLQKILTTDVLGRTIRPKLTRRSIDVLSGNNSEDMRLRPEALLMAMKSWTSLTLMALKPFTGLGNGFNAMMLQHKDALKDTVSAKLFGIEEDAINYTFSTMMKADRVYFKEHIVNAISGKLEQDKTWLMLKKLGYLNDDFGFKTPDKYLLSKKNRIMQNSSLYGFHTIPEEFTSMTTMISQLMYLKHPTYINPKTGKKASIWDCYKVVPMPNGEYDVIWDPIIPARGLLKEGSGEKEHTVVLKELIPQEVSKLKKIYEKVQGGYKTEEYAAIEVYAMGKMFMQFKRYYPRLLLNAFGSKRMEQDFGYLKKDVDRKTGEDVYTWMQRVNEGRFRILGKMFITMMRIGGGYPGYKWSEMKPEMKVHVIDAGTTLGIWILSSLAFGKMFGDDKEDDSLKMWWKMYAMDNFIQQYSPLELTKIGVQGLQPVAFTRALQTVASGSMMMGAGWDYTFGNREDAFTNKGDFKGWNQFRKSLPFFASYYDFVKRIENSKDLTKILQLEQFSKWR